MPSILHCRQDDIGLIRIRGRDARSFLHAQLTQNIARLDPGRSTLAAWLSPQGRVRALFDVVPADDGFLLLTAADNVEPTIGQLGLFVLRSEVRIDSPAELAVHALVGDASDWLAERDLILAARAVICVDGVIWLRIGPDLVQAIGTPERLETAFAGIEPAAAAAATLEAVRLGLPSVPVTLRERYIPQMLNLERLDAIAFDKGCYPGQEIVARTQNLGSVKRRLLPFTVGPGPGPEPGAAITDAAGTIVGEVNRSAPTEAGHALLAVVQLTSASETLTLAADGRSLAAPSAT